jgi:secondary thiamine-phosphate synthase enzyme
VKVFLKEFTIETRSGIEVIDITDFVESAVRESGISNGLAVIHLPHATAALLVNEYEEGLVSDIVKLVRELFKPGGDWKHNIVDSNAHAHLASAFIGSTRVVPVINGELLRGTWQNILLLELDGPRKRRLVVEVLGE